MSVRLRDNLLSCRCCRRTLRWIALVLYFLDFYGGFFGWIGLDFDCFPLFVGVVIGANRGNEFVEVVGECGF